MGLSILGVVFSIMLLALGIFSFFVISESLELKNNSCLGDIAIKVCEDKGMFFDSKELHVDPDFTKAFSCKEDLRAIGGGEEFKFLEHELKECGVD